MNEKSIQILSRDKYIEKLKKIGQHRPDTLREIKMKLCKFLLYWRLNKRLKLKVQRQYKFECSLDPSEVSSIRAKWWLDEKIYLCVENNIFSKYCPFKHQGNKEQQEKTIRMLQSIIFTVKTTHDQSGIFFRAMIKKVIWYNNPARCDIILKVFT